MAKVTGMKSNSVYVKYRDIVAPVYRSGVPGVFPVGDKMKDEVIPARPTTPDMQDPPAPAPGPSPMSKKPTKRRVVPGEDESEGGAEFGGKSKRTRRRKATTPEGEDEDTAVEVKKRNVRKRKVGFVEEKTDQQDLVDDEAGLDSSFQTVADEPVDPERSSDADAEGELDDAFYMI